ncbi:MAG: HEXXH motif-containing putative peptide modification protein [Bacteroidota bacterium]
MNIDWSRVAAPQADGYDTEVVLYCLRTRHGIASAQTSHTLEASKAGTAFEGAVDIRYVDAYHLERFTDAPADHTNLLAAARMVKVWEPVYRQFQRIVHSIHPWEDKTIPEDSLGSCSHSLDSHLGTLYATVNSAHGLAQAFVHEMAHNKLRALGIMLESTDHLITNPPHAVYESPIRKDRLRPMTAVFHAQYSFMHCTALDIENMKVSEGLEHQKWRVLLQNNLPRMKDGDATLKQYLQTDHDGEAFFKGFFEWSDGVLAEGQKMLTQAPTLA